MRWSLLNSIKSVNYQLILRRQTLSFTEINRCGKTTSDERAQVINGRIGEALGKLYVEKVSG
jgi:hypothetical protein